MIEFLKFGVGIAFSLTMFLYSYYYGWLSSTPDIPTEKYEKYQLYSMYLGILALSSTLSLLGYTLYKILKRNT